MYAAAAAAAAAAAQPEGTAVSSCMPPPPLPLMLRPCVAVPMTLSAYDGPLSKNDVANTETFVLQPTTPDTSGQAKEDKGYCCDICLMKFQRGDQLRRHKRRHTGEKPFQCDMCDMRFLRSDHLHTHKLDFKTHFGEKPYACAHCTYASCRRDVLNRHTATRHRDLFRSKPTPYAIGRFSSTPTNKARKQFESSFLVGNDNHRLTIAENGG